MSPNWLVGVRRHGLPVAVDTSANPTVVDPADQGLPLEVFGTLSNERDYLPGVSRSYGVFVPRRAVRPNTTVEYCPFAVYGCMSPRFGPASGK